MSDSERVGRNTHVFTFTSVDISLAAIKEAEYHREREDHWNERYLKAVSRVEETIGAKLERIPVTGGFRVDVVVDYGDPAAYAEMQLAWNKIATHRRLAEEYESDSSVYGSQPHGYVYTLTRDDVRYFRLGGEAREDEE